MAFFAISKRNPLQLLSATDLAVEHERLLEENAQLHRAVTSHAVVDQAIGAVVVMARVPPEEAWHILRDISQRTNTKLRRVAERLLAFAQNGPPSGGQRVEPAELRRVLERSVVRAGARPDHHRSGGLASTGPGGPPA
ncbi:ANTAR domain-containing protein [Streptomyces sp. K1PA1]|uniref:ANTAR domain-containing protein n=2 Tax=Streptomyces tropicalis TaxID=3034234 RepID=A0ABT6AA44_9ACTN|nr:ANTAR domain-containing protein [Streptomyces tropicalis]